MPGAPSAHRIKPGHPRDKRLLNDPRDFAESLRALCHAQGFEHVRFCAADGAPGIAAYDQFLAAGHHADMAWMVDSRDARAEPRRLLREAESAIVLGMEHRHLRPPDPGGLTGKVAAYAWGRDYHNLIGKRIKKIERWLREQGRPCFGGVDSRPFIERAWAERAGLGYAAKNCFTIRPGQGSGFFLAVILVGGPLPPDAPLRHGLERFCGSCARCHLACPTAAFVGDGQLDARRCISTLTIESDGPIPEALRPKLGRWVFGCDDCQDVCPHNHRAPGPAEDDFAPVNAWLDLRWLLFADDDVVEAHFEGSPLRRPGAVGLKRNAAVVLGNLGDPTARPCLEAGLSHPSALVVEHCDWALRALDRSRDAALSPAARALLNINR